MVRCIICCEEIDDSGVACSKCSAPYHAECWDGKCARYGCTELLVKQFTETTLEDMTISEESFNFKEMKEFALEYSHMSRKTLYNRIKEKFEISRDEEPLAKKMVERCSQYSENIESSGMTPCIKAVFIGGACMLLLSSGLKETYSDYIPRALGISGIISIAAFFAFRKAEYSAAKTEFEAGMEELESTLRSLRTSYTKNNVLYLDE